MYLYSGIMKLIGETLALSGLPCIYLTLFMLGKLLGDKEQIPLRSCGRINL